MKKVLTLVLVMVLGVTAFAQTRIQLRSADKAQCVKSDMTSLKASFSFSGIEAFEMKNDRGVFSTITMPNTVTGGSEGEPQIPVVNQLIAVPFGATPTIRVTNYSSTDYNLEDYGIHRLTPRQPDLRKDQDPKDVPFVYNEAAYQKRGLQSEPMARVSVNGTLRGVQVGQLSIEPVSYDPVNNTLRVFNNIEVEVSFNGADIRATEDLLVKTYSPYFNTLYKQLFNGRAVLDVFDEHPDLWGAPVKMLVIANRMFESCIQDWVAWKTMKGIYVDVNYTDEIGTSASAIKTFIQEKYAQDAPTFLMIMGDKDQVAPSISSASETDCVSDLYYSSADGDEFVDMFHSRFPAETVAQMTAMLNKALEYEQYTMPDPSYLSNVLLIAGEDSGWGVTVGRPTIWYATNYYYNADHGFNNVYEYSHGTYTGCYNNLNTGVGFVNYTAHGSNTSWAGPSFTVSDVNNLTNEHKYFLAMGNCCQAADWGISSTCFGEAMVRAENKGAYAYIGSCPSTYWLNDYYFGVGATNRADGTMPTMAETGMGCYDAIWDDDAYNTVNSILYIGNLAGNAAEALGYELHISTLYYWQAYHVLGDGSIMPFRVQPTANEVSHMAIFPIGMATYEVSAVPGSYVALSKDGELIGTALVDETGTVNVQVTPVTSSGDVTLCVTAPNRIPVVETIPAAALEGAYIAVDSYTPNTAHVGDNTNLDITFKNVGSDATTGTTTITLSATDDNVTILNETGSFGVLATEATATVTGFSYKITEGVADKTKVTLHYTAVCGNDMWEGNIVITANEAVLEYQNMAWNGGFTPGETLTLTAKFKNTGHYQATNAVAKITTSSNYLSFTENTVEVGTIAVDEVVSCQFTVTIADNCPETAVIPVTFTLTADGDLSAQGNERLKNACNVVFNLMDSYGDGWNGASLGVSFDDGTPSESLTFSSGGSATYTLEIGNGTHVTLTWNAGSYDGECSFTVSYEGDLTIFSQTSRPSAGVLYEFDCNCAAASQTFMINVSSANTEQGTVSGGGEFGFGQSCTVTATPAEGYMFANWTMNDEMVSSAASYTFIVTSDMDLVANFAVGTMIGDGSETTDQYLPSYSYYNYSLTQQIYTIEELGAPGNIMSIAFFNGGQEKTRSYDFYMKNTSKSTFANNSDWEVVTEADKVFSGSVTMNANDWTYIVFDSPFLYDGSSNIVLVADDNSGTYSQGMACRVFNAANQTLRVYSDGTNYNPFAPASYSGTVMNVKNQLLLTKESLGDCVKPTNLTATEIGPDYIMLSWTENGASEQWVVNCNGNDFTADTNEDFILEGLEPETAYTISVRPTCGENMFSSSITITTLESCPVPQYLEASNITGNTATLTWGDYNDSYNVQLGMFSAGNMIDESFDNSIPAGWENDVDYPWTIVDGHMQSGNTGIASSTSSISITLNCPADGTLEFDAVCNGEGTSTYWDHCDFYIDNNREIYAGANISGWNHYSFEITAGTHTFTWSYTKDGSVDPTGDYFAVDNIVLHSVISTWNESVAVDDATYTFTGLNPETTYCVRVQGICNGNETDWSETYVFTTNDELIFTKDIAAYTENGGYYLIASPVGQINPEDVENLLENSYDLYAFDQAADQEWLNYKAGAFFELEPGKGYLYANSNNVTLSFSGQPYDGDIYEVTLALSNDANLAGWNLVGNPFASTAYINRDFYTMNADGSEIIAASSNSIEAMEGVFVTTEDDGEILTFTTEAPGKGSMLALNISQGRGVIDRAILRFGIDSQLPKFQIKDNSTKLFIPQADKDYAVVNAASVGEMPLCFKAEKCGSYTLSASFENVEFGYLHLIDNLTGADIDLLANPTYSFEANSSDYASRFKLVFATGNASNGSDFAFFSDGNIIVNGEGTLQVFDVTGRVVSTEQVNGAAKVNVNAAGVYVLQLSNGESVLTQKIVVK